MITATTGKAASNIQGSTLHLITSLPVDNKWCEEELLDETCEDLKKKYDGKKLLIIDEISMLTKSNWGYLDKRLKQIMNNRSEWFGGLSVIFCGDLG